MQTKQTMLFFYSSFTLAHSPIGETDAGNVTRLLPAATLTAVALSQ